MNITGHSQGQLFGHSEDQLFLTQKFKILNFKTLSAGLFTTRVHGRVTLAVSSLVYLALYIFHFSYGKGPHEGKSGVKLIHALLFPNQS